MYEHAANAKPPADGPLLPIWHLDRGWSLFIGPLGRNASHAHSVPVYVVGVYAPFRMKIGGGDWLTCRSAVVPAGVPYEFDVAGQPLAVLYLEPNEGRVETLMPLAGDAREVDGALVSDLGPPLLRELYEARDGAKCAEAAVADLLSFAKSKQRRVLDARVSRVVDALSSGVEDGLQVADAARNVGLSASRFQHLFVDEIGVPFRRFRVWQRLRTAIGEIAGGNSFTDAAHAAGFFDQAHFARAFRSAFGAPASPSLRKVRQS